MERTRAVLALQLWMNGINIALSVLFVLGFGWGVVGVAAATLIAELLGLLIGVWLCRSAFQGDQWRAWGRIFDPLRVKRMMMVSTDIMIRSVLLTLSFTWLMFQSAGLGDVPLAANQILIQFMNITAYALDGFAFAAEALVGAALGAGDKVRFRQSAWRTSLWGACLTMTLSSIFWFAGPWLVDVMTTAPDVRLAAREYLIWVAMAPLVGTAAWMLDGIFIGATRTRDMRNMMIVSVAIYIFALWVLVPPYGNDGLWAALLIFFAARGLTLALRYPALERSIG